MNDIGSEETMTIKEGLDKFRQELADVGDLVRSAPRAYLATFQDLIERNERRLKTGF